MMKNDIKLLKNSINRLKSRIYYLDHKDYFLQHNQNYREIHRNENRQHDLVWVNRRRKYYRESKYEADMPVDLAMMRNRVKFNEGLNLEY